MFRAPLLVAGTPEISLLVNFYHITALIIMKSVLNILLASYASVTAAVSLAEAASALEARTIGQICDTPYVSINPLWLPRSLSLFFSPFYLTTPLPFPRGQAPVKPLQRATAGLISRFQITVLGRQMSSAALTLSATLPVDMGGV